MKKFIHVFIWLLCFCPLFFAQEAKIVTEHVTPHDLTKPEFTAANSVSSGLDIVPNGTYVYLSAKNIGDADTITNAVFTITSKPAGSTAAIEVINSTWVQFKPDVKGAYEISLIITTAKGTDDATKTIYSANYVGVGNFGGVTTHYPNCMTCHQNTDKFVDIFNRWKVSGHANVFNQQIETGTHYTTECMKCHTTGYDHNVTASNGGFDDIAAQLGWSYTAPSNSLKWDTLKTQFPGLVNLATIGCESCHGPGSEHTYGANPDKIQISLENGVCAQCHDEPSKHNKYSEFENSAHIESVWETTGSTSTSAMTNNLGDCIRCHDGRGYVNFTKGLTTDGRTWTEGANGTHITCATCHDPHGNTETASLRPIPVGSDTLANGYHYTEGGAGRMCLNCHKARSNNVLTLKTAVSQRWGPHHSTQGDVLLGQNAADFGTPFSSGNHKYALQDACVTCHMAPTTDPGTPDRDKVGGHSFRMHNPETGYDNVASCTGCHG
ncbi:MAG TPA: multiheme c-type cytochrome, partial [Ignavibacteriaceae bacterium]|nr:multiheme c-type cytochrome [Ignavibacteriaceae bacterium]